MWAGFQFGEWLPDAPDAKNPGLERAKNTYPTMGGYGPFESPLTTGTTVAGDVVGAKFFRRADGTAVTCLGTKGDLFVVVSGTATPSVLGLTVTEGNFWEFEQFGVLITAVCEGQETYYLTDIESDLVFSPLTGSPPMARTQDKVGQFLVLGNLNDGTSAPFDIQWSAFSTPTDPWVTNTGKQSGRLPMPFHLGEVTAIAGERYNMVFQRYGVSRLEHTNSTTAFTNRTISEGRGCIASPSAVAIDDRVYFLAHDGFCVSNGTSVAEIGNRRINEWFLDDVDGDKITWTQGAINWIKKCVVWSYVPSGGTAYTRQIIYSWQEQRWSTAEVAVDWLVDAQTADLLVDNFETVYGNSSVDDPIVASKLIDSAEFRGGDLRFAGWLPAGANSAEAHFNGPALETILETGEFQPAPGRRSFVSKVRPFIENTSENTTVAIGSRKQKKGGPILFTAPSPVGVDGAAPVRSDGRWQRTQIITPENATWDAASGFEAEFRASGQR